MKSRKVTSIQKLVCSIVVLLPSLLPSATAQDAAQYHQEVGRYGYMPGGNQGQYDEDNPFKKLTTDSMRFNKFYFPKYQLKPKGFKPLTKNDYPIRGYVNATLRASDAISIVTLDDYEVHYDIPSIIESIGGMPDHPSSDEKAPFWDKLRHVMKVQKIRRENPTVTLFPRPEMWQDMNLNEIATAVHDEFPGSLQADFLGELSKGRWGTLKLDTSVIPKRSNNSFLRTDVLLSMLNGWAISFVGPHSFAAKWYCGRPRPEEVVWNIKKGKITEGIPADIKRDVRKLVIRGAGAFTAYPEGCPRHPAWPAMHAATASTSFWLSIAFDLNDEQLCQARLTDFAISYGRTVAGVHYPDDNIAGLNIAQEVLARGMPKLLYDTYDIDPEVVAKKISKNRYDWNKFNPQSLNPCG
jgi:hypothetical protein